MSGNPLIYAPTDADYITATDRTAKGLPNSIPVGAITVPVGVIDDVSFTWGSASGGDVVSEWSTAQTNDSFLFGMGASNTFIITTKANVTSAADLTRGNDTHPTLVGTSATAWGSATDEWWALWHDGSNMYIDTGKGAIYLQDEVYSTTHLYFGDSDNLVKGTGNDSIETFDGTDHTWTFAAVAVDVVGSGWALTMPAGGTISSGTTGAVGGFISMTTGAGSAAKAASGAAGGAGGDVTYTMGAGGAGDGAGVAGRNAQFTIVGGTWVDGATTDGTFFVTATLNATEAAGGSDEFSLIKGSITATDITGYDNAFLINLEAPPGTSVFSVTTAGVITTAAGLFLPDDVPIGFGNAAATPDAQMYSDGAALVIGFDATGDSTLKLNNASVAEFVATAAIGTSVYWRGESGADNAGGNGYAAADMVWRAGDGGDSTGGGGDGGVGGTFKFVCGDGGALNGGGATGADGTFQIWHNAEAVNDYIEFKADASAAYINAQSALMYLQTAGTNRYAYTASVFGVANRNAYTLGAPTGEWMAAYVGEDTTTGSVSTSGVYFGQGQEVRLRWNKDATNYPASSLILGLEAAGTAAKDCLALSSATITGFANTVGDTAGEDIFIATQTAGTDAGANPRGANLAIELGLGDGTGVQGTLSVNGPVVLTPATAAIGLFVDQNNNVQGIKVDSEATSQPAIEAFGYGALYAQQDKGNGYAGYFTRNIAEAGSLPLVSVIDEHANTTQHALSVRTDSSTVTTAAAQLLRNGLAAVSTDALLVENSTAATEPARVQMSPRIRLHGEAWRVNATAASQTHDWIIENLPAEHATVTTSALKFGHSQNGAGYTYPLTLSNSGLLTTGGSILCGASGTGQVFAGTIGPNAVSTLTIQNISFTGTDSAIEAVTGNMTNGNGTTFVGMHIKPKYTQGATTAAASDLVVSRWEASLGSGAQLLIDAGVTTDGTYANHTFKFKVDNSGNITAAGSITAVGATLTGDLVIGDTLNLDAGTTTDDYFLLRAFDTGNAMQEVGRVSGGAIPYIALGGTQEFKFYQDGTTDLAGNLTMNDAAGPVIINAAATNTVPTLIPNKAETDTGIGWASDVLHMICGGASYANISISGLDVTGVINTNALVVDREAVTASVTTDAQSLYFGCDTVGADTITLQTADCVDGRVVIVKDEGGNALAQNITIDTQGGETIDGAAQIVINTDGGSVVLIGTGSNWHIVADF